MTSAEILNEVNRIFIDQLENENIVLTRASTADDIEEWDSLTHIQLIVAIEKHFNARFTSAEIYNFRNVGEMCDALEKKKLSK
jgi:acyl carrier protein